MGLQLLTNDTQTTCDGRLDFNVIITFWTVYRIFYVHRFNPIKQTFLGTKKHFPCCMFILNTILKTCVVRVMYKPTRFLVKRRHINLDL